MLADVVSQADNILPSYGLAGLVILTLALVCIFLYREARIKDLEIGRLYDARLQDAKDVQEKFKEWTEQQTSLTQKIYDLVISQRRRN